MNNNYFLKPQKIMKITAFYILQNDESQLDSFISFCSEHKTNITVHDLIEI